MPEARIVIVVGASLGGVEALRSLAASLPASLPAAILAVLHIGAHKSELPTLLSHAGEMLASHPENGDRIQAGHIYVAPPDHHLTIEQGAIRLTKGPRENWARPAIDPLFRSAAHTYGPNAIGVILTGALNDGTAGLLEIKACGGTTIVQDPDDAVNPSMPRSALDHVTIDHCLPLTEVPRLLCQLVADKAQTLSRPQPDLSTTRATDIRAQDMTTDYTHAQPVAITCPDCGGALARTERGSLTQFRCHIGHVYTAEVMIAAQSAAVERSLETALRSLGERGEMCRQMQEKADLAGDGTEKRNWEIAGGSARRQAIALQTLLASRMDEETGLL